MALLDKTVIWKGYLSQFNIFKHPLKSESPTLQPETPPRTSRPTAVRPSLLAPGTVVTGTIHSETGLVIFGRVNGNIFSQGDIEIRGEVTGNLTGCNIRILEGRVQGDIQAEEHCQVLRGTLEGNIASTRCEIDGTVQGNISSRESLNVHRSSVIRGDIATRILQIEGEAQLSGMVQMEVSCTEIPCTEIS